MEDGHLQQRLLDVGGCSIYFLNEGRRLLVSGYPMRSHIRHALWNLPLGIVEASPDSDTGEIVRGRAVSEDGLLYMSQTVSYKLRPNVEKLFLRDASTGRVVYVMELRDEAVFAAAFSPDGKLFAAATEQGRIHLWKLPEADNR
jgi:WD40 repeat protein